MAFLAPFVKKQGCIVPLTCNGNVAYQNPWERSVKAAGLWPWSENRLRDSFCSYRYRATGSAEITAEEGGHSVQVMIDVYRKLVTKEAAERFWAIVPAGFLEVTGQTAAVSRRRASILFFGVLASHWNSWRRVHSAVRHGSSDFAQPPDVIGGENPVSSSFGSIRCVLFGFTEIETNRPLLFGMHAGMYLSSRDRRAKSRLSFGRMALKGSNRQNRCFNE
jgi:hypothetical protein